jgi:hypothetical protein
LNRRTVIVALAVVSFVPSAQAAVASATDTTFVVKTDMTLSVPPDQAYARFVEWGRWWSSDHSFSGSAANFSLKIEPGGCLCEAMPGGGFVQHSTVVVALPGKALRLNGALGPLLMLGGSTSLAASFKADAQGTKLSVIFTGMGSEPEKGLKELASAYDSVLSEQLARFKRYAESGKP